MGCFRWVAFYMPCPKCGTPLGPFQTKDETDLQVTLPHMVKDFYTSCPTCTTWVQFTDGVQRWPKYDTGVEDLPLVWRHQGRHEQILGGE